jgi:hypothetical protein
VLEKEIAVQKCAKALRKCGSMHPAQWPPRNIDHKATMEASALLQPRKWTCTAVEQGKINWENMMLPPGIL